MGDNEVGESQSRKVEPLSAAQRLAIREYVVRLSVLPAFALGVIGFVAGYAADMARDAGEATAEARAESAWAEAFRRSADHVTSLATEAARSSEQAHNARREAKLSLDELLAFRASAEKLLEQSKTLQDNALKNAEIAELVAVSDSVTAAIARLVREEAATISERTLANEAAISEIRSSYVKYSDYVYLRMKNTDAWIGLHKTGDVQGNPRSQASEWEVLRP